MFIAHEPQNIIQAPVGEPNRPSGLLLVPMNQAGVPPSPPREERADFLLRWRGAGT